MIILDPGETLFLTLYKNMVFNSFMSFLLPFTYSLGRTSTRITNFDPIKPVFLFSIIIT